MVLDALTQEINGALEAFIVEMKAQGRWDDLTIVLTSEFGRTMTGNTGMLTFGLFFMISTSFHFHIAELFILPFSPIGNGRYESSLLNCCHHLLSLFIPSLHSRAFNLLSYCSDHAWGGNYFVAGGEVRGSQILGTFPDDLSEEGPHVVIPGAVIPSTPWEAVWNGIAQWFGVTTTTELNEVLPNRNTFSDRLFSQGDMYDGTFTDPPTFGSTPAPTPAPQAPTGFPTKSPVAPTTSPMKGPTSSPVEGVTSSPVSGPSPVSSPTKTPSMDNSPTGNPIKSPHCVNSPLEFYVVKNGKKKKHDCLWVAEKVKKRCDIKNVQWSCPQICGKCAVKKCKDSKLDFEVDTGKKLKNKDCSWVKKKRDKRCGFYGVTETCRESCSLCPSAEDEEVLSIE